MKKHAFCEQLLKEMTLDEKIQQVSCIMPLLVSTSGKVDPEKLKKVLPNGIGRMTQFCGGFVQDGKQAAEAYNAIQKYQIENTPHHIPVLIQNESACGLQAAGATVFPARLPSVLPSNQNLQRRWVKSFRNRPEPSVSANA